MSQTITVDVRHLGNTRVDVMNILPPEKKSANPLAWTGLFRPKKDQRIIPCTCYVIKHPKGLIVVDTGFDKAVRAHPIRELTLVHNQINKPLQKPGEAVDEVLAKMGIRPEDIDYVILSHLHSDHADGARQLIGAKHFLVSREELDAATQPDLKTKLTFRPKWREGIRLETFEFADTGLGPVGKSFDLFGDGTVSLIKLPGHTPGMSGVLIRNNGKQLVLAADCGYSRQSYMEGIVPAVVSDPAAFKKSLDYLKAVSEQPGTLDVLVNHDDGVPEKTYTL